MIKNPIISPRIWLNFQTKLYFPNEQKWACAKTRNNETKPPKRNHRNERNERNETTETSEATKTKNRYDKYDTKRPKKNHGPAKDRIILHLGL